MIPAQVNIYVCTEPVDMRYGFDRLLQLIREKIKQTPEEGGLFAFVNRKRTRLKVLWFEANGTCVLYKRLHKAKFVLPIGNGASVRIDGQRLAKLLAVSPSQGGRIKSTLRRCEAKETPVVQSA